MEEEATKRNGNILVHRKIEYLLKMKQKKKQRLNGWGEEVKNNQQKILHQFLKLICAQFYAAHFCDFFEK